MIQEELQQVVYLSWQISGEHFWTLTEHWPAVVYDALFEL